MEFPNPLSCPSPFSKFLYLVSVSTPPPYLLFSPLESVFQPLHSRVPCPNVVNSAVFVSDDHSRLSCGFSHFFFCFCECCFRNSFDCWDSLRFGPWPLLFPSWSCLYLQLQFLATWSESVKVLVPQLCLTLCDPVDWNPPASSVHGITQARTLEWVATPFSRGSSQPRDWTAK